MVKHLIFFLVVLFNCSYLFAQWKPVGERIKTDWANKINVENVLPEYPRPIMERTDWMNLNGLWNYVISPLGQAVPQKYDGQILVPFAVESSLSGVGKMLGEKNELWYQRKFTVPSKWKGKRVLLHFGAVDWKTDIWVNQVKVGQHTGGFPPFSFDITPALLNGENELVVKVWDPTDKGFQPRGKQVSKPGGIWYTPVSGIWQTVWLEAVNSTHILQVLPTADIHKKTVSLDISVAKAKGGEKVKVELLDEGKVVGTTEQKLASKIEMEVPEAVLWSPSSPKLYHLNIELLSQGQVIDQVNVVTSVFV